MTDLRRHRLPSRTPGVISRAVGDEYVVIHPDTKTGHSLSGVPALVWRATEGGPVPAASEAEIEDAVRHLIGRELLVAAGPTRRALLHRGGLVLAGTGIASIVLPEANAAASTTVAPTTVTGTGSIVIPAGSHDIVITFSGGGGGYAQDRTGTPGTAGSITFKPGVTLTSALTISYNIGTQGSAATSAGNTALTNPGGTGAFNGGDPGGSNQTAAPDLGGGGGAASRLILSGAITGTLIAGGGGGAGNGYSSTGTPLNGGTGGSVTALGAGGAGGIGQAGTLPGTGGLGGVVGGSGAAGQAGTASAVAQTNGGGGGGGGGNAGLAGGNGTTTSSGGGGGAGSSSIGTLGGQTVPLAGQPSYGTVTTVTNGSFTYSYIKP